MTYSPLNIEGYHLVGTATDFVKVILEGARAEAIWNLYWLTDPTVDTIPEAGANWHKGFTTNTPLLLAVMADVDEDEVLYRKLMMGPAEFRAWWARQDVSMYDTFDLVPNWHSLVMERAHEAAMRLNPRHEGNVIHVQFRRRA